MAIYNGNKLAKKLYVGTKPVRAVYAGSRKVWPSVVRVVRGVNYGAWTYADPVRRRTATPWEQDIYCDDSVGDVRYGATSTQEETATVSYTYGSWSYADPKRSRTKTTIYKYSDTTRTGGTVTETQTAATAVDWDGSTYWNGSCGSNYYYVDYKKVRTRYTYNDVTRYSGYYNGDSRSRRIEGSCGWVRSTIVVSDWANTGALCNAAGTVGGYDCDGTYKVQYYQQKRILEDRYPDGSGGINNRTEYRVGSIASRQQVDGYCDFVQPKPILWLDKIYNEDKKEEIFDYEIYHNERETTIVLNSTVYFNNLSVNFYLCEGIFNGDYFEKGEYLDFDSQEYDVSLTEACNINTIVDIDYGQIVCNVYFSKEDLNSPSDIEVKLDLYNVYSGLTHTVYIKAYSF